MKLCALTIALACLVGAALAGAAREPAVVIKGQEKWTTVGANHPQGLKLTSDGPERVTAGFLRFPEGKLRKDHSRDYMGVTIAKVRTVPASKSGTGGKDYFWSEVNGWPYTSLTVTRRPTKNCPNGIRWVSVDLVLGDNIQFDCDGVFNYKSIDALTYWSIGKGAVRWGFYLERLGKSKAKPIISSVSISRKSRVGITRHTLSRLKLVIPSTVNVEETDKPFMPATVKNLGGRKAIRLVAYSGVVKDGDLIFLRHMRRAKLAPLAAHSKRKIRIPIAPLPKGDYKLLVGVAAVGTVTEKLFDYQVEGTDEAASQATTVPDSVSTPSWPRTSASSLFPSDRLGP